MRKFSLLGAAVLSLAMASSVFAATPTVRPDTHRPTTTVAAPAAHHWTASFKGDGLRVRTRLFAAPAWRFGWLEVQVRGLTRGAKLQVTLADQTTMTAILDTTRTVRSRHGVRAFLVRLDASQMSALKAAVTAKDALTVTIASGSSTASGQLEPARG